MRNVIGADSKLRPLIDFDLIFDKNLTILYLIQKEYNDSSVFDSEVLNNMDLLDWKKMLHVNPYKNPLYTLMDDFDTADKLYKELIAERKEFIYNNLYKTDIFQFVHLMEISAGVIPTVLCKNEFEMKVMEKYQNELCMRTVLVSSLKEIPLSSYNVLYLRHISDLYQMKNIEGLTIYLSDDICNFESKDEELRLIPSIVDKFKDKNRFRIISLYNFKK